MMTKVPVQTTPDETLEHFDNAASASLAGYAEFINRHEELIKQGVDRQLATIESLKALHATEASRYRWLADQAEAAGDLKRATVLAKEADNSARLVVALSQQLGSSHQTLKAYLEASESALLAKTGGSKAAQALLKKSGAIGNIASLIEALSSDNDVEVTKAVANIVVGGIAGTTAGFFTSLVFPPGAPAAVAAASLFVSEVLPELLTDTQWQALTELAKDAINEVAEVFGPYWQTFLRTFGGDLEDIATAANDKFLSALNLIRRIDPLVLDLDGDGIETLATDAGVLFDFDGDGIKTGTGWIKGDDGFLVFDRDGNGLIDSGKELFGVDTVKRDGTKARNGFDALADLDSNGDGLFDENDEMFSRVRVWQDLNRDGIAQANELKTLAEHRIKAIVLKSQEANEDSNGNLISATSSYIREDGSEGDVNGNHSLAADVDLESNPFYSEHTDPVEVDDEVNKLPSLRGSGLVRELREASMLSPALRELVAAYAASSSHREQQDMLDRLIAAWAATGVGYESFEQRIDGLDRDGVDFRFAFSWDTAGKEPTAAQSIFRDRLARLNVLESFNGQPFLDFTIQSMSATSARIVVRMGANTVVRTVAIRDGVAVLTEADLPIWKDALTLLDASYKELAHSVQSGLLLQTRLKDYADLVDISLDGEAVALDFGRVFQRLEEVASHDPVKAILDGLDLHGTLTSFHRGLLAGAMERWLGGLSSEQLAVLNRERFGEGHALVDGSAGTALKGGALHDLIAGNAGNDSLAGDAGNDWLFGGDGNDSIGGGSGNDTLIGGMGDDKLDGGTGSDVYVFGRGHGRDTISNYDGSSGVDAIQYLEGIRPDDILVQRNGRNLFLTIRGTQDRILVEDYFHNSATYHLDEIRFADGTVWSREDVKPMVLVPTDGNDTIIGYGSDDHLAGGLGNDSLSGLSGNDLLDGGEGNDSLNGGDGDDILTGGTGDDRLDGAAGSDVYVFGRGHGKDTISNYDGSSGVDAIQYLDGIRPDDILVQRNGRNLFLTIRGTQDRILVEDYFHSSATYHLDEVRFSDDLIWNRSNILAQLDAASGTASAASSMSTWPGDNDVHALVSAMAGSSPAESMASAVVPPNQQAQVNWASMAG